MKRSRSIRLVLLGGAGISLAACGGDEGPPQDARFFSSVAECSVVYEPSVCESALSESREKFVAEAPKFTRQEECEAEFGAGNCETQQASAGSGIFMPMMMGYMLGSALSNNRFAQPVYRGANGSAVMPRGGKFFNVGSFAGAGAGATAFRPATQVSQVSRGGFGQTASAHRTSTAGG